MRRLISMLGLTTQSFGASQETKYFGYLGRRHRPVQPERLHQRPDGLQDSEHRQDRE